MVAIFTGAGAGTHTHTHSTAAIQTIQTTVIFLPLP